uniref:RING finger protein 222-like n=2 Tax=Sinocyclocheilus anshuiensis TaxID=1608454 RepID=A0A671T5R3_9TELE
MLSYGNMDEEAQDSECPVCYESLSDSARALSCGHHFCHDCLVLTLVNTSLNGSIKRDNIICPVCRHLTFITKLHGFTVSTAEAKRIGKTLELPSIRTPVFPVGSHTGGLGCICRCLKRISCRLCRRRLVCPKDASEVFIISELGRPMTEGDVIDIETTSGLQQDYSSHGQRLCTISCCLLILMITFTLLALVAATLPWVLLA